MITTTALAEVVFDEAPNFVFPSQPSGARAPTTTTLLSPSTPTSRHGLQRKSASALPVFSFNQHDTSGLASDEDQPFPRPSTLTTPRGHRRGASELVGGSAPPKSSNFDFASSATLSPRSARGHAHRRSGAISVNDLPLIPPQFTVTSATSVHDADTHPLRVDSFGNVDVIPGSEMQSFSISPSKAFAFQNLDSPSPVQNHLPRVETVMAEPCSPDVGFESPTSSSKATALPRPDPPNRAWSEPCPPTHVPDLETLFLQADPFDEPVSAIVPHYELDHILTPKCIHSNSVEIEPGMIDLDVALSLKNAQSRPATSTGARRQLHSSRSSKDPGFRRRAESAPLLTRFEYSSCNSPTQSPMDDVFEEDEEDFAGLAKSDTDATSLQRGLGIESKRVQEAIEIVHAEEEPRDGRTKTTSRLALSIPPSGQASLMTPTTYAASTFSSPDVARRQASFDTSCFGTSASSVTSKTPNEHRPSVDGVPSLTSTRSALSRRLGRGKELPANVAIDDGERRRKRSSIHSLGKLVGSSFKADSSESAQKEHRLGKLMFWRSRRAPRV